MRIIQTHLHKTSFIRLIYILTAVVLLLNLDGCSRTSSATPVTGQLPTKAAVLGADDAVVSTPPGKLPLSDATPAPTNTVTAAVTSTTTAADPNSLNPETAATQNSLASEAAVSGTPVLQEASTVTLLAVGDNLIHTQVIESGEQEDGTYHYDHLYSNIKDAVTAADIAVINQETIFGEEGSRYSGYPEFNSPTQIGDAVINAGFDVVLHATNHTMDIGVDGIRNTLDYWKQHPEITVLGIHETEEAADEITIVEKNGIKIAMLNYTYGLNGHSIPAKDAYMIDMLDRKAMKEDIERAEEEADFTVVFPHWGTEYVYEPVRSQEDLTEFYYDLGVDLVIGTHPHVLEPVEWIETDPDHKMLIYYSLGNFMSYQKEAPRMLGGLADITITKDSTGTYISDASITPIVTHYENGPSDYNYAIYKLTDYSDELADKHGVSEIAREGALTYDDTYLLAQSILGDWFR